MFTKIKLLIGVTMTVALLAANIGVASAHQWCAGYPQGCFHWDKSGPQIVIQNYNYASHWQDAENARLNGWSSIGILYNYGVNYHTDISVFDGNFGATGWDSYYTFAGDLNGPKARVLASVLLGQGWDMDRLRTEIELLGCGATSAVGALDSPLPDRTLTDCFLQSNLGNTP